MCEMDYKYELVETISVCSALITDNYDPLEDHWGKGGAVPQSDYKFCVTLHKYT